MLKKAATGTPGFNQLVDSRGWFYQDPSLWGEHSLIQQLDCTLQRALGSFLEFTVLVISELAGGLR